MLDKNSESRVHVEAIEEPPQPGKSIAFGLERMGLIAVKGLARPVRASWLACQESSSSA